MRLNGVTYTFPTSDGAASGRILATNAAGQLSWTSAAGAGLVTVAGADARYVMVQGDTMTGGLLINLGGSASASIDSSLALEVVGTMSGRVLHAQDLLTTSGALIAEGAGLFHGNLTTKGTISGANLTVMAGADSYIMGNVGIGTSGPQEPLHIKTNEAGTGTSLLRLDNGGTSGNEVGMEFYTSATDSQNSNRSGRIYSTWDGGSYVDARLSFQSMKSGNVLVDTMHLKNGNVGIGTSSPTAKLTVSGGVIINEAGYASNDVRMEGDTDSALFFLDASADMVGIGTLTPTTKLEVIGTMSGNVLHAQDLLTSSGGLVVEGAAVFGSTVTAAGNITTRGTLSGANLTVMSGADSYVMGNLGVGTSSPSEKLEVSDRVKILDETMESTSVTFDGDTSAGLKLSNTSGYITLTPLNSGWAHIYTDRSYFIFNKPVYSVDDAFSSYDADLQLRRVGTTKLTLGSSTATFADTITVNGTGDSYIAGDLGIGDSTPGTRLEVAGGIPGTSLRLTSLTSCAVLITNSDGTLSCGSGETFVQSAADARDVNVGGDTMTGALAIKKTSGTATGNTLVIDTKGLVYDATNKRVGIGTAAPVQNLHIDAASGTTLAISTDTDVTVPGMVAFSETSGSTFQGGIGYSGGYNTLGLYTGNGALDTLTQKLTLERDTGDVGIGDTTPGTRLEVAGGITGTALRLTSLTSCSIVTTNSDGTLTCGTGDMIDITEGDARYVNVSGDTMTGALSIKKASGTATGNTLIVDTTGLVYDATNKRVGIGTASPGAKLEIGAAPTAAPALLINGNNGHEIQFTGAQTANIYQSAVGQDLYISTNGSRVFIGGATDATHLTVDSGGNIGIGDTTPSTKLEVAGGITGTSLRLTSLTSCAVLVTNSNGTLSCGTGEAFVQSAADARYVNVSGDTMTGALTIKKTAGTATGTTLIVDTKGLVYDATNKRVGIGTASPRTALEVLGAISGSSLSIRDSITGSGVLVIQGATTLKSTLAVTGNVTTQGDLTLNSDQGAADTILTFGSDTTNETLKFLNNEDRFEFSDDVRITGGTYASGALIVDGAAIFKSTVRLNGVTYTFPTSDGTASGRILATNAAGQLSWTKGFTQAEADSRYVMVQGDTMTGGLLINVGGAASAAIDNGIALEVAGTVSGSHLHAQSLLTSSGQLIVQADRAYGTGSIILDQNGNGTGVYIDSQASNAPGLVISMASTNAVNNPHILFGYNGSLAVKLYASGSKLVTNANFLPTSNDTQDLGSSVSRCRDLYLGPASVHMGANGNEGIIGYSTSSNYLSFDPDGDSTAEFVMLDSGRLGIGTTSPTEALEVIGTMSGNVLHAQDLLTSSGGLIVEGAAVFGSTVRLNSVTYTFPYSDAAASGYTLASNSAGQLSWTRGFTQAGADARYVMVQGDTMTGGLLINVGGAASASIDSSLALEVVGTMSGRVLHAQDLLTTSGALIAEGAGLFHGNLTTKGTISGANLTVMAGGNSYIMGNVGIGTATPSARLDIVDNGTSASNILEVHADDTSPYIVHFQNDNIASGVLRMYIDASGNAQWQNVHTTGGIQWGTANGSTDMTLDANGNLGIEDTTPGTKLEVAGGITGTSLRLTSLTSCAVLQTNSNGTLSCSSGEVFNQATTDARYVNISGDTMTGALSIKKASGTATGNTLIVDTKGLVYDATNKRVGIGTASPRTSLEVLGAISGSSLSVRDSITGSGVLVIQGATTLKSTLAVTGNVTTQGDLSLNSDQGAADTILTFGSDTTNETLKFLNNEDRFEFSDDVRITGGTYASGALIVDGAAIFKSTVRLNGVTYTF